MSRFIFSLCVVGLLGAVSAIDAGCGKGTPPVASVPPPYTASAMPAEPLVSSTANVAYAQIADIVAEERTRTMNDTWLTQRTKALARARALVKHLRGAPADVYAVSSARVAWLHEDTAYRLGEANSDLRNKLDEQGTLYWTRCANAARAAPPHLDAWAQYCDAHASARHSK